MGKEVEALNNIDSDIVKILGLKEDASKDAVLQAISVLKAEKVKEEKTVNSEEVATKEHKNLLSQEGMMAEINRLNVVIAELQNNAFNDRKTKTINSFIEKGKITPVSYDFYMKSLNSEECLNDFIETMDKNPSIKGNSLKPKVNIEKSLNSEEVAFAKKHGFDEKVFLETKKKMFDR